MIEAGELCQCGGREVWRRDGLIFQANNLTAIGIIDLDQQIVLIAADQNILRTESRKSSAGLNHGAGIVDQDVQHIAVNVKTIDDVSAIAKHCRDCADAVVMGDVEHVVVEVQRVAALTRLEGIVTRTTAQGVVTATAIQRIHTGIA